jgi:hypothetical protein
VGGKNRCKLYGLLNSPLWNGSIEPVIGGDAKEQWYVLWDYSADCVNDFEGETGPVLEGSTVLVGAQAAGG